MTLFTVIDPTPPDKMLTDAKITGNTRSADQNWKKNIVNYLSVSNLARPHHESVDRLDPENRDDTHRKTHQRLDAPAQEPH